MSTYGRKLCCLPNSIFVDAAKEHLWSISRFYVPRQDFGQVALNPARENSLQKDLLAASCSATVVLHAARREETDDLDLAAATRGK